MFEWKRMLADWKVILVLIFILLATVAIYPNPFRDGVVIKSVEKNSSAMLAGVENPRPTASPMSKEFIVSMNNVPVKNIDDYYSFTAKIKPNATVRVQTSKGAYVLHTKEVNSQNLGFRVDNVPVTNLKKGLDLQGGTRVLLKPAEQVSDDTMGLLLDSLKERLNVYGLSDIIVTEVRDRPSFLGEGNRFILVEIAGATEEEVVELIGKQGKFEAKIANSSVFKGGNDITYVCRTAECSGIDPERACGTSAGGWVCGFRFAISLSPEAAERQADATMNIEVVTEPGRKEGYLVEPLRLFLDDQEVDSLNVAEELKGRAVTDISITGSGAGISEQAALLNALENMKRLQTVLITGSLPVKLEITRIDNISPVLGGYFIANALFMAVSAIAAVVLVLLVVYRKFRIAISIMLTALSEIFIVLGIAALIGWNLDLSAIAGLIISVGTGVNDQIVIVDEALSGRASAERSHNWKERIKRAFFVIFSAYATITAAMVPLLFAGAGLLKGFALTTILGFTVGVLITRPAFAAVVEILIGDE
ncbi:hypothetical protein HY485_02920 [Candidatus Woesearchaeota archaeon]|nr:hypothetical protein [Candidatus Woesearchaeota archaeon]